MGCAKGRSRRASTPKGATAQRFVASHSKALFLIATPSPVGVASETGGGQTAALVRTACPVAHALASVVFVLAGRP